MPVRDTMPPMIPELCCTNIKTSLSFYVGLLGFRIVYQREEDGFAMLERQGSWLMLDQFNPASVPSVCNTDGKRSWITGPMEKPFGRGINFEMETTDVSKLADHIEQSGLSLFLPLEEKWYRADEFDLGVRQFIVLDPDGYALRFSEDIGTRPHRQAPP